MPQGGTLQIITANAQLDAEFARRHAGVTPGRYVALTVWDTGVGMRPDVLAHAFEPFFTTKAPGRAAGLGLSTVYAIARQSGGHVTVESSPDQGTKVTVYLPAIDALIEEAAPRRPLETLSGRETILLVEDDVPVRKLVRQTLAQYGYTILEARDIADALALAESHDAPIELLLTEVAMPDMSGPNLAQRLLRRRPDTKVLYVSGFPHGPGGDHAGPRCAFLAKPFTRVALLTAVRRCLDG
jgi:CheY-like chemotaxis protein